VTILEIDLIVYLIIRIGSLSYVSESSYLHLKSYPKTLQRAQESRFRCVRTCLESRI